MNNEHIIEEKINESVKEFIEAWCFPNRGHLLDSDDNDG